MDLNSLKDTISNITLYDVKAAVRKAQNVVMNFTEMEAKVREATNNEPWGASSTLMNEIANGTYNYAQLNEIMNMIYKRFTEKAAEEWRQIYKALQLLEFLVKNGSERVIDDARQHLSTIKMLKQFHYIDQNGKDQGLNVRNRAKELAELLSDVERIRQERKKARQSKNKYQGVEGGWGGMSSSSSGAGAGGFPGAGAGSRYGGFGSEELEYGGYSGGVYGDGGGFSGGRSSTFQDSSRTSSRNKNKFEEYDEYDEADATSSTSRRSHAHNASTSSTTHRVAREKAAAKAEQKPAVTPVEDLFSFGDNVGSSSAAIAPPATKAKAPAAASDDFGDDDFDDFQSAAAEPAKTTTSIPALQALSSPPGSVVAPKPVSASQTVGLNDLVGFTTSSPSPQLSSQPSKLSSSTTLSPTSTGGFQPMQPNYFTSVPMTGPTSGGMSSSMTSSMGGSLLSPQTSMSTPPTLKQSNTGGSTTSSSGKKTSGGGDAFGSLWSTAAGIKKPSTPQAPQTSLAAMQKEKASAGIWGASGSASATSSPAMGNFSGSLGNTNKPSTSSNGLDDLLM